jgi:hypothetical protein
MRTPSVKPQIGAAINPTHPLSRGLVGCFLFNEGMGRPFELVSRTAATLGGTLTWTGSPTGPALQFSTASVASASPLLNVTTASLTLIAFIRMTAVSGFRQVIARATGTGAVTPRQYGLYCSDLGRIGFETSCSTYDDTRPVSATFPAVNTWAMVGGTYDGATKLYYANGVALASVSFAGGGLRSQSASTTVGQFPGGFSSFGGQISQVRIYDRALSQQEMAWVNAEPFDFLTMPYALRTYSFGKKIQTKVAALEAA